MSRSADTFGRLAARLKEAAGGLSGRAVTAASVIAAECGWIIDRECWNRASGWRERARAISWTRAAVAGGLVASLGGGLVWLALDGKPTPHAPKLPTEVEWRAAHSASEAMEGDLSPALAAANRSVAPKGQS